MKWLRWIGSGGTSPMDPPPPSSAPTQEEGIDLKDEAILKDAIQCARHALVMEFRNQERFDPLPDDLAKWAAPTWNERDKIRSTIQRHNPMALTLGERFPVFWEALEKAVLNPEKP